MNNFYTLAIKKIITESSLIKTFCFSHNLKIKAGQFVMLWVPGIGQKPFSVGYDDDNEFRLTIFQRGCVTTKLFTMQVGDNVGIAGPYGTAFTVKPNTHYIMIAGGYGVVPLAFLAERVSKLTNTSIDFCLGARDQESLIFEKRLQKIPGLCLHIATNDGAKGYHGHVTELLPSLIESVYNATDDRKKMVAICGPELMEKKALDICNRYQIPCEISIERYIKCGIGICGQCAVDNSGVCLCKEGPVVSRKAANKITELGIYARDNFGLKHFFEEKVYDNK